VSRTRDPDEFFKRRGTGDETAGRVIAPTSGLNEDPRSPLLMTVECRSSEEDPVDSTVADEPATPPVALGHQEEPTTARGVDHAVDTPKNDMKPVTGTDAVTFLDQAPRASVGVRDAGWCWRRPPSQRQRRASTSPASPGAAAPPDEETDGTLQMRPPRAGAHV